MHNIIFAKPGDEQWTLGSPGEVSHRLFDWHGRIAFQSLASFGGRCYFSSPEGSVSLCVAVAATASPFGISVQEHLFLFGRRRHVGRLLLMRYYRNIDY